MNQRRRSIPRPSESMIYLRVWLSVVLQPMLYKVQDWRVRFKGKVGIEWAVLGPQTTRVDSLSVTLKLRPSGHNTWAQSSARTTECHSFLRAAHSFLLEIQLILLGSWVDSRERRKSWRSVVFIPEYHNYFFIKPNQNQSIAVNRCCSIG